MAIDGSFCLESELERFLARCPKLGCLPRFVSLSKKANRLTEEEVVNSVADLFLHPDYTIPLVGCYRPIVRKIVDKAVALLSMVPNLRSYSDDTESEQDKILREAENFDNADAAFRFTRRMGLKLHELACLAFCRALDLAPFLLGSVLSYFKFAPPPFERLIKRGSVFELSTKDGTHVVDVARVSYRLLLREPEVFSKLWDWSCFLDLVQKCANFDQSNSDFLNNTSDLRWCGIQILSVILKMSDKATANFGVEAEEALTCLLRWDEFCHDVSLEKAAWYLESSEQKKIGSNRMFDLNHDSCLQSLGLDSLAVSSTLFHESEPSAKCRRPASRVEIAGDPFVLTSTLKKSFEMVLLAVSQKWLVLLYGPAGGGKTALISKLARESGHQVLSFHMDDQIDVKTLIGGYVCTEQPGEFRWQHGSLTQAVEKGYWVVFEDIDKAPMDVQSILLPLLEGARSFVTGHGEAITVAEGFRLFSTISTFKLDGSRGTEGSNSPGVLWRRVMIGHSSAKDLQEIVKTWYPNLESLAWKLIETFESVNAVILQQLAGSICKFSLRDLLKWCKRIAGLGFHLMGDYLSAYECNCIYHEAVDVFAAFSTSVDNRLIIMRDIARIWAVPASLTETLYPLNKPIIQDSQTDLRVGRVTLQRTQTAFRNQKKPFVEIRNSLHVLERIACSVKFNEPILLVGETGTGKTTLVQNLALRLGQKLTVLNLSQQSDIADLLGGFKPMDTQFICVPLYKEFEVLFSKTFSIKENKEIFVRLEKYRSNRNWNSLLRGMQNCVDRYHNLLNAKELGSGRKRKKPLNEEVQKAWEKFMLKLETAHGQIRASSGMLFSFVEGAFVSALRNGDWILLDEVNLAPLEILQRVIGVLEGENGSFCLAERGDVDYINRHPNFRIFACMNPATDAGKRDLPYSLRSRFTEYFVDDVLDEEDLALFINQFMDDSHLDRELVYKIVRFYKDAKKGSEERLQDGANQKPQYSLRSLYRALEYTQKAKRKFGFQKAFYDGFCMFFLTLLDGPSAKSMKEMILSYLLGGKVPPHVPFDGYLMVRGDSNFDDFLENYVLTRSVKDHLTNLARAVLIKRYPVLLQGPTSSGKTSLVQYLAAITGHEFVRINNHEHTDLQEYLGTYITDACGKLVFHEGVLVKAVRNGHWIVLDELNLAPSDVLEALNRLLDDNRELFVPELRETVCAHPDFMLFATQNPPTFYGGRKMLSRAFRNRFVEVHVDEIPDDELSTILEKRCKIPGSYAKEMVEVMKELQLHRQGSKVFAGKHGFITPRDLFRWADRYRNFGISHQDLAREGYYLLAERLRNESEKAIVKSVLDKHHRAELVEDDMYKQEPGGGNTPLYLSKCLGVPESLGNITWTKTMERLYFLLERCYKLREPVLLVGETGGGKTTVCQLLSIVMGSNLHILNCHQYTETSDFLGGFYPVRERSTLTSDYKHLVERLMQLKAIVHFPTDVVRAISADISQASLTLDQLNGIINGYRQGRISSPNVTVQDVETLDQMKLELAQLHQKWQTIFMWQDGPLIRAMKDGDLFLVDEISLADDSVLERLNSVLEPERKLSLAEKGGSFMETVTAHSKFFLLATMNPGGDYGKKELSPALRNRFTEIWVSPVSNLKELRSIALQRFSDPKLTIVVDPMLNFMEWFNELQTGRMLTVRDLLSWVAFINATARSLQPDHALLHGAFLVLLDGLSLGTGISKSSAGEMRRRCLSFLLEQLKVHNASIADINLSRLENYGWGDLENPAGISCSNDMQCDTLFGINPFYIDKGDEKCEVEGFKFSAPTTRRNALRVLRAMQLMKPVLLEGSPGVGKTSLIVALGKFSGHRVVRINLSEQTDIMDLLGSDLPVESDEGIKFAWSDGILLQALKNGCWVLLDELNLAPQSVLEGLNAILDHRAEVFIPELGHTFKCPSSFRVFACQNPSYQGGGRKGLPKSFLNRFTKVYVDELVEDDYLFICSSLYPLIPKPLLTNLIFFNKRLHEDTMLYHKFAQDGSPWEFNLRDVIRSCQIIEGAPEKFKFSCFLDIVYVQRMRMAADRREVIRLYEQVFGVKPFINPYPRVQLNSRYLIVGNTAIQRNNFQSPRILNTQLKILPGIRHSLEAAAQCVKHEWLCILIGPPSSGKTSLIRILAQLTGNVINELNLSSATDISELLGCFEQYNDKREFRFVVAQLECYVNEYCSLLVASSGEAFDGKKKDLVTRWLAFLSSEDCKVMSNSSLTLLIEIVNQLRLDMEKSLPVSWSFKDLSRTLKIILKLQQNCHRRPFSAKFEWLTGLLIKAIERGEWVVLENANLCSPTVLDRINSLVEPCGSITVNECGIVDGQPVVVQPHPNFRMFLTVNPSYGEVSRAMRNRGVEIFMMQPYWLLNEGSGNSCEEVELKDLKRFIILSGIPIGRLVDIMAKAYNYAKGESLRLNKHITYLELARWVQLFQQLISNGNQPMWSLQISWEHTFISPLGEPEGGEIIAHVKDSYLSLAEFSEFDSSFFGCSLCLPGGWSMPLMLSDFVLYSKEASVKQNCLYLEYMGAQCASYESRSAWDPSAKCQMRTYFVDLPMLHQICFPTALNVMRQTEFDLALANKMLLFASNWIIEQATERDISLYFLWFSWFNSRIQPFCQFFGSFLALLQQEMKHPIWNCIIRCRQKLLSDYPVDLNMQPIPMLSFELADLTASNDMSKSASRLLRNAISCVGPLRLSFQQWNVESDYSGEFALLLKSLRVLEEEVLNILLQCPSFDVLIQLYTDLLEDHIVFWNYVNLSQFEYLGLCWHDLMKAAVKLRDFCPKAVKIFLMESRNLDKVSSWHFNSQKSLLWSYGGHPYLPPSRELYDKQHQLLVLCELIWPRKTKSWNMENNHFVEVVVSSNPELRFLAMQGVCMSSHIMGKSDEDNVDLEQQLEKTYQFILGRFECEKHKLETNVASNEPPFPLKKSAASCVFFPEALYSKYGLDSWKDTLPVIDSQSFFLDMELLQELSMVILVDGKGMQHGLSRVSNLLETALKFSLDFSSRSPMIFLPHQKILWTVGAWSSVDAVSTKISSFVFEMWFGWHSSLWAHQFVLVKNFSEVDGHDIPLPDMIFQPVRTATIFQILQCSVAIRDYHLHCLKLRVVSCNFWQSSPPGTNVSDFLLSAARSLFQQIIFAHKKSFKTDKYAEIKSLFSSFQKIMVKREDIRAVSSLIASSSHQRLTSKSLMDFFIKPILEELYLQCPSTDFLYNLGCAWLRIGGLRFHLLLVSDDLDPTLKYSCKDSQLVNKMCLLKLEMKVRQECDHLAGSFLTREADEQRAHALENIEVERKRLQRKIVFRSDPGEFKKLKYECHEFLNVVTSVMVLIKNVESMDLQQISDQVRNWQETATSFIDRLSNEYAEYIDIIQPVQVAVYEMKLGVSLVLSGELQKKTLKKVEHDTMDGVLDTIYSFMRFPRGCAFKSILVKVNSHQPEIPFIDIEFPTDIWPVNLSLLEKLLTVRRDLNDDHKISISQLKVALYQTILTRITHSVAYTLLLDNTSFGLLDKIFDEFTRLWMNMKIQAKSKEDYEAQQFKFRSRTFKLESIFEYDISNPSLMFPNESFPEWEEFVSEEHTERKEATEEHEALVDEWNYIQEHILKNLVLSHNQLFGSCDLAQTPGNTQVSDSDKLLSFIESYTLGVDMIKGLEGFLSSSLDAKLLPEHLLRLSLEHEQKFVLPDKSTRIYNFYKDSNAPAMVKMVELLTTLKQQILSLLKELEDHPDLQRILDVIEMLLAIPLSSPLAKALLGLQFLLHKARILQENVPKHSISNQLEPVLILVSSWQKLEFESWPALLDEVQDQYDINAGKLWFPLYSVLHHRDSLDIDGYSQSTIQSLKEFIQTSSIGEFKKRLQLLLAFYGQINAGLCVGSYSSLSQRENLKILYNLFGYYLQFLPTVLKHIEGSRRNIEMELKELLKLCRWERPESYMSLENFKKPRQKLKKLIQKYTDVLQQSLMLILDQERIKAESIEGPKLNDFFDKNGEMLGATFDMIQSSDMNRSTWCAKWREGVDFAIQNLHLGRTPNSDFSFSCFKDAEVVARSVCQSSPFRSVCPVYQEEWKEVWCTLEKICRTARDCDDIWNETSKSPGKKRAWSELLKLLESCGLSKHKPTEDSESSQWVLEPSYDVQHLLLTQGGLSYGGGDVDPPSQLVCFPHESLDMEWRKANQYYFKSMATKQLLCQIHLKRHKDLTLDEVNISRSFIEHLIVIQQEQRGTAYDFAEKLSRLRLYVSSLKKLFSSSTAFDSECIIPNQHATFICMWRQKQLFDCMCAMLHEESLLLKTVESAHSCSSVKEEAHSIVEFINNFVPIFQKSKESLDKFLLGNDKVISTLTATMHPCVVSKQMEQLVAKNFLAVREFEEHLCAFHVQDVDKRSVKEALLSSFEDILKKAKLVEKEFCSDLDKSDELTAPHETYSELGVRFDGALKKTLEIMKDAFKTLGSLCKGHPLSEETLRSIPSWKFLFESYAANLQLDRLCDALLKMIFCAVKLVGHSDNRSPSQSLPVGAHMKHVHELAVLVLNFGDRLLHDFLAMHKTVSVMTHVLANLFASLYVKGFGIKAENESDDRKPDLTSDANGTGMGAGEGMKDVSEQLTDEDQLLGLKEKSEEQALPDEVPNKNDKGIEMNEDFVAEIGSVSEDSGDESEEECVDEPPDSAMGQTGAGSEVVDEKLWDKEEDENPTNKKEKYETGPSVKDQDPGSRELRAKEDSETAADDFGEAHPDDADNSDGGENGSENSVGDTENMEDVNMDKEAAFADPSGLKLDEPNQTSEEIMNMDDQEGGDPMEEACSDEDDMKETGNSDGGAEEKKSNLTDEMDEEVSEQVDGTSERDNTGNDHEENTEMDLDAPIKDVFESGNPDSINDHLSNPASAAQPKGDSQAAESRYAAPDVSWSNSSDVRDELTPVRGLPSNSTTNEMEISLQDSSQDGKPTDDQPKTQLPKHDSSSVPKSQSNPYRNVGDALEEWKERVKVSLDLQKGENEDVDDMEDENADEYGFTSQDEKGTAQALGPASSDQIDKNINASKPDGDGPTAHEEKDVSEMEIEKQDSEMQTMKTGSSILKSKIQDEVQISDLDNSPNEESPQADGHGDSESLSESLVSMKRIYVSEDIHQLSELSLSENERRKAQNVDSMIDDTRDDAVTLWRRYELRTTILSQELAEQLRLVMEPTLASKLQGDYKTGKRINMRKVIAYIASDFQKDNIWLRRLRPNKRDYQVVIAMDDSRSMSESGCGDVAIEALVTVCRAMSQLEVGSLAVASFGKEGNIKLLHDFEKPFCQEAGVEMISGLTFQQENTIGDEPVIDLLKYLNNMLDTAVVNARLPSGQNPLQQLVLIISDGRINEKDMLKRHVRELLSKKRLVAFLLLDSSQESIMDLQEAVFDGRNVELTKYLDSFPFPYYIILKEIEALPRTLADLLRQWFELMQNTRD